MTCSKITFAMFAGFLMGQIVGPCDGLRELLPRSCQDVVGTGPGLGPPTHDSRSAPPPGHQPVRRGGLLRFIRCAAGID